MDSDEVEATLYAAESALSVAGPIDLGGLGFWKVVGAAKRDPAIRERYGERIAAVDREALSRWALVAVGIRSGTWTMIVASGAALAAIAYAYALSDPWNGLVLLAATGALLVTTHGLAHLAVGRAAGIRFTHWFIGSLLTPQPGVKVDYVSYLATPARARARMHAAGAVVTKALPFLLVGAAWGMGAPAWTWVILVAVGIVTIITDVVWSTTSSDWKRYRRERRLADAGY